MKVPQFEIVREGYAQRVFIDGREMKSVVSFSLTSDADTHPKAELTLTILGQIKEKGGDNADS